MLSSPGSTYAENLAATTMLAESLSVSVNVMVTALILFKLSRTWSGISKYFPNLQRPRMYTNAAAVVIESAAPLTVFGICYVIVTALAYHQDPEDVLLQGRLCALSEVSLSLFYSFCVSAHAASLLPPPMLIDE
jgi:hypothetical protein